MIAEELINHMVPPLKKTDDAHKAIIWMEELRCKELPVVENMEFLGLVSEELIIDANEIEKQIGEFEYLAPDCFHFSAKGHRELAIKLWNLDSIPDSVLIAASKKEHTFTGKTMGTFYKVKYI